MSDYLRVCTEQSESAMSASFLIRVTLRPLNARITITSQWMSQTQTKDMGHHRLRLRSVQKYFAYFCVLANESWKLNMAPSVHIVWVGIFSSDLSAFISQSGQKDWGSVRISDISILWWNERESWEQRRLTDGTQIWSHCLWAWLVQRESLMYYREGV